MILELQQYTFPQYLCTLDIETFFNEDNFIITISPQITSIALDF